MEVGFLIISYTKGNLNNVNTCLSSIRKFYPNEKVVVVDNFISGNANVDLGENVYYSKNNSNSYEMGAIWYGVKTHPEVDRWITIHDSCKLIDSIPTDIYQGSDEDLFIPFWKEVPENYSPTIPILINYLKGTNVTYEEIKNEYWSSVCGLMFISDKKIINSLIDLKFDTIKPSKKIEAVCSEVLLGLGITYVTKKELKPLHIGPISAFIHKKKPWEFIEKYAKGLGSVVVGSSRIPVKSKLHPRNLIGDKVFTSQNECVKYVSDRIVSNTETLEEIIKTGQNNFEFENGFNSRFNIGMIYKIARHRAFTFKYFEESYSKIY